MEVPSAQPVPAEVVGVASRRPGGSWIRRAGVAVTLFYLGLRRATRRLGARPAAMGAAAAALVLFGGLAGAAGQHRRAPAGAERVSALALARQEERDHPASPAAALKRAAAAIEMREFLEALEVLERARVLSPAPTDDALFIDLSIQTFNAGHPARTAALLASAPADSAVRELQLASVDWSLRVRHGVADVLKASGVPLFDPVAAGLLDVWQTERCEQRRATAARLLAVSRRDPRLLSGLEAAARRAGDEGCLRDLLPAVPVATKGSP